MKKIVLDTNVLLNDPGSISYFQNQEGIKLIIPNVVIKELDTFKTGMNKKGYNARSSLRQIEELMDEGLIDIVIEPTDSLKPDDIIVDLALSYMRSGEDVCLVTNDLNMRCKAKSHGLESIKYDKEKQDQRGYLGYTTVFVDNYMIDDVYGHQDVYITEDEAPELYMNEYIVLQSNTREKGRAVARFISYNAPLEFVNTTNASAWDIKPRNYEQYFALDALMDPEIKVVSLIGIAGSGKTLLAVAAGIAQVFGKKGAEKHYKKMLVTRPIQPLGNDIGFLPGTEKEKLDPWIRPIMDNLEVMTGGNKSMVEGWMESGDIEVEAITYIRGRSINDCFIIIDEAQNLTGHEIKTILTRVGEGTKIILTGDVEQIDNSELNEFNNGLTYAVEKLKEFDISAHVTFTKGERSRVAEIAAKVL